MPQFPMPEKMFAMLAIGAVLCPAISLAGDPQGLPRPSIELTVAHDGYDPKLAWSNSHLGLLPSTPRDGHGTVMIMTQKAIMADSDNYLGLEMMESRDDGRTWTEPKPQPTLQRHRQPNGTERSLADFALQWSPSAHRLWGTGGIVDYRGGDQVSVLPGYSLFDRNANAWGPVQRLELPQPERFRTAFAGNAEWAEDAKGNIFLPIYHQPRSSAELTPYDSYSTTVLRCRFDGEHLRVLQLGNEMSLPFGRGFCEPGVIEFGHRYYLTLRNDLRGYVTVSGDGLHYPTPEPWRFDDGTELGSYNTEQRWLSLGSRLFLVYTRTGLDNDFVYRNRAPLMLAEVDAKTLRVRRTTEQILVPNRGAPLAAWLSVVPRNETESWVCATEDMENAGPSGQMMLEALSKRLPAKEVTELARSPELCRAVERFGSNGRIYVVKVRLPQPATN